MILKVPALSVPTSIRLFRRVLSILLILNYLRWIWQAKLYLLPGSLLNHQLIAEVFSQSPISLLHPGAEPLLVYFILGVGCLAGASLFLGYFSFISVVINLGVTLSINQFILPITYVDDWTFSTFLVWLMILPNFDNQKNNPTPRDILVFKVFRLFIMTFWLISGVFKFTSPMWRDGLALATTSSPTFSGLTVSGLTSVLLKTTSGGLDAAGSTDIINTLGYTPGTGSVTSVALSLPLYTISSPVTSSGTLTGTLNSQSANTALAAPSGAAGVPSFRALTYADLPFVPENAANLSSDVRVLFSVTSPLTYNSGTGVFGMTNNSATTNTPSTYVARDASGNFAANVITANNFSGSINSLNISGTGSGSSVTLSITW